MTRNTNRLLMIDDEPAICEFIGAAAETLGFEVRATSDAGDFRGLVRDFSPTVLITDLNMPKVDGIEVLRILGEEKCQAQVLVISGEDSRVLAAAHRMGTSQGLRMAGVLGKPVLLPVLKDTLKKLMPLTLTESDLREAIETGQLAVHYQPKLAYRDHAWTVEGAEALVRWQHPGFGIVMPNDFLPLAKEADLMGAITDAVLRETLEQMGTWSRDALTPNVAVNLDAKLLTDVGFPDRLAILMRQYDVDSSRLTLEITETAAMTSPETAIDILTRLRIRKVNLAIDDFGSGYSSMKRLFNMPFSELKIDGSLISQLRTDSEARTIVDAMINLGHNLHMSVCAEYVESREILDVLEKAGCDKVQGFFISKPIRAVEFAKFMADWRGI